MSTPTPRENLLFEIFGLPGNSILASPNFLCGIECEVECHSGPATSMYGFIPKADSSLRNSGVEYVSEGPTPLAQSIENFTRLQKDIKLDYKLGDPWSSRTSTHVHINCASLTAKQARNLVLLYALFEEPVFSLTRADRRENIHCVPLTETHMPSLYKLPIQNMTAKWHKYTALNLKRLVDLGSMEFRHLQGTGDPALLGMWLNVLERLWTMAKEVEITEDTLTNRELIRTWFEKIFYETPAFSQRLNLFNIIGNSLMDVKLGVI